MASLQSYLDAISEAWDAYRTDELAALLSLSDPHTQNPKLLVEDPAEEVDQTLDEVIADLVLDHLKVLYELSKGDPLEAYEHQKSLVTNFNKLLSSQKDQNWPLPIMHVICLDLRRIATRADHELSKKGGKPGATLEKAAELMMNCFRTCALDSKSAEDVTKRWGMLNIVNQLFKIYFKVNKMHLCKPLIRAIESSPLKDRYNSIFKIVEGVQVKIIISFFYYSFI